MTEKNLLSQWARLLLRSFSDARVDNVVLSPGSRSTPFAVAALANPALECHTVIDERDAAFFALGQAKHTGAPVLLICTSGTAGANYLPAVIEAKMSYTPLLILTADRPTELAHCHAPQTIDQVKLFGDHARAFFELGAPDPSLRALRALRRAAAQAVSRARGLQPGAVHLNARAPKPLEPVPAASPEEKALEERVNHLLESPITETEPPILALGWDSESEIEEHIEAHERGLIVCGPGPAHQNYLHQFAKELSEASGYPLLVEAASQWRYFGDGITDSKSPALDRLGTLDALGRSPTLRQRLVPQVILQLGAPPTAKGWDQYVEAHPDCPRFVVYPHGWADPWNTARRVVHVDLREALGSLITGLERQGVKRGDTTWNQAWWQAETLARQAADEVIAEQREGLSEGLVARVVVEALPAGGGLALGNSLPIREVDAYSPPWEKPLTVWSQRGASGIDGVLAGAAGFVSSLREPSILLIGDVSFLHSLSGLATMSHVRSPLAIVVVNNDGGRIFEQLPLAEQAASQGLALDPWITPHGLDLEPAAQLFRLPFRRVETKFHLRIALAEALARTRTSIIEAKVPPGGALLQNQRLWQSTEEAVAREITAP